ncbi:MAG TPA: phosphoenolpyruvate--protein phosphotransferase [Rhabdochlamydiaceae bacterium]|jgi:phosphotransferase system enzyme I (PtsI)
MEECAQEMRFQGFPVSEGIAIGIPFFLTHEERIIPSFPISAKEIDSEIARYRHALFCSKEDLRRIQKDLEQEGSAEAVMIIDAHIMMLDDPLMTHQMEEKIRQMMQNTESVFHSVLTDFERRLSQNGDAFFQQRFLDIMDIAKRVLGHLCPLENPFSFEDLPQQSIIFANELVPSHTATAQASKVSAFVTQAGGGNSHAALIARAKGIPFVACIDILSLMQIAAPCVIVDGQTGEIILNPSKETLEKYKHRKTCLKTSQQVLQKEMHFDAETMDGCSVQVFANIGHISDLDNFEQLGSEGVGLLRTEYLFFHNRNLLNSEEDQYAAYVEILRKVEQLPLVIRVFDVGGDKQFGFSELPLKEPNPVLGCRGIRFLLRHKEVFRTQLRAILRSSAHGNVRILLPLISDVNELHQTRQLLAEIAQELKSEGKPVEENIPLGCMIEVPSAVLICDVLSQHCDFVSIGTNDLVQYTLGIDRNNPLMSDFCYPAHPSVIRMIKMVVTEAKRHKRNVTLCGEMASNPLFIPLLLGLGIDEFSCSPRYIPLVKRAIRQTRLIAAYELAQRVLGSNSSIEISKILLEAYDKNSHILEE